MKRSRFDLELTVQGMELSDPLGEKEITKFGLSVGFPWKI